MAVQGYEMPAFTLQSKENSLRCTVNRGAINLAVFKKETRGAPFIRIAFDQTHAAYVQIMKTITDVMKAPLNNKASFGRHKYDIQSKRYADIWNVTFEKDAEMVYKITLTDIEHGGASATFTFRAPGGIFSGGESSKAQDSQLGIETFINWLKDANANRGMTYEKFTPGQGGNRGGNGGAPSAPVATQAAPSVVSDPDDLPF